MSQPTVQEKGSNLGPLMATIVISVAIAGYFTGLQAPMTDHRSMAEAASEQLELHPTTADPSLPSSLWRTPDILPAAHYSEMSLLTRKLAGQKRKPADWPEQPATWSSTITRDDQILVTPADKNFALELRQLNRAFNGAPPTVPHSINQMSSDSCMLCHGQGLSMTSLRASKMSHQYLSECTQCHVENDPKHMPARTFGETTFVGLPAPKAGPRAFPGAPPQIPHTTWMRVDCLSCHGPSGEFGIRTTHPWRQDCQQCHAVASGLEQTQPNAVPNFLPPLKVSAQ